MVYFLLVYHSMVVLTLVVLIVVALVVLDPSRQYKANKSSRCDAKYSQQQYSLPSSQDVKHNHFLQNKTVRPHFISHSFSEVFVSTTSEWDHKPVGHLHMEWCFFVHLKRSECVDP